MMLLLPAASLGGGFVPRWKTSAGRLQCPSDFEAPDVHAAGTSLSQLLTRLNELKAATADLETELSNALSTKANATQVELDLAAKADATQLTQLEADLAAKATASDLRDVLVNQSGVGVADETGSFCGANGCGFWQQGTNAGVISKNLYLPGGHHTGYMSIGSDQYTKSVQGTRTTGSDICHKEDWALSIRGGNLYHMNVEWAVSEWGNPPPSPPIPVPRREAMTHYGAYRIKTSPARIKLEIFRSRPRLSACTARRMRNGD